MILIKYNALFLCLKVESHELVIGMKNENNLQMRTCCVFLGKIDTVVPSLFQFAQQQKTTTNRPASETIRLVHAYKPH